MAKFWIFHLSSIFFRLGYRIMKNELLKSQIIYCRIWNNIWITETGLHRGEQLGAGDPLGVIQLVSAMDGKRIATYLVGNEPYPASPVTRLHRVNAGYQFLGFDSLHFWERSFTGLWSIQKIISQHCTIIKFVLGGRFKKSE